MEATGIICKVSGGKALISAEVNAEMLKKQRIDKCLVIFDDGRRITAKQRKCAYATIRDIADYTGHNPEYLKEWFKYEYVIETGGKYFSLSDCSVTVAREYINILMNFCLYHGIPMSAPMIERTDDINAYLYACLYYRKCAVCGRAADVHHVTGSKIGMGVDRQTAHHLNREAVALCRIHHNAAHANEREFLKENHIYGIRLDETLCERLNLRK